MKKNPPDNKNKIPDNILQFKQKKQNRLAGEKSPYLLQHAENPVDWYAWGEEAFERARAEDKPIFLSIGYATCHWCHVMERECFEDTEVADVMNSGYICIKVDREERPDIDQVYMTVAQLISHSGGWPLNIIMTPEKKPFFAGTYIPKRGRFDSPGMMELLPHVKKLWLENRDDLVGSADKITKALVGMDAKLAVAEPGLETASPDAGVSGLEWMDAAYKELADHFDPVNGGFGGASKFPTPHNLDFLIRHSARTGNDHALLMAEKTLKMMRLGGIFDHVGFGFHRYSTDARWMLPHFEKMLYDQALIADAYTEAYQATKNDFYKQTAREVMDYVLRDMTDNKGGFHSAQDADSEGVEGKFYVWSLDELEDVLGSEAEFCMKVFNVSPGGNFRDEATGEDTGLNILYLTDTPAELAKTLDMPPVEFRERIKTIREKLLASRQRRTWPLKDDKVLTDWNGLMIASLARAGSAFGDDKYVAAAKNAAAFIIDNLRNEDGLLHRYRDGCAGVQANLTDYAYFIRGLLELYQATFDNVYLKEAVLLNKITIERFWDESAGAGGFFFTPSDGEALIHRQKDVYDGAQPSGNSACMMNLLKLASITGDTTLTQKTDMLARAFASKVEQIPSAHTYFLSALDFAISGPCHVVVVGLLDDPRTKDLLNVLKEQYMPNLTVLFKQESSDGDDAGLSELISDIGIYKMINDMPTAYVCSGGSCAAPVTGASELKELLSQRRNVD